MEKYKCEDCKDTEIVEVESVIFDRGEYDKSMGKIVYKVECKGDWHTMQCHCVGDLT